MNSDTKGTCYLLHFERPYKHARHYLGWTNNLQERLDQHLNGTGGRLLEVITAEGIGFVCARLWPDTTLRDERRLKAQHSPKLCPICNPGKKISGHAVGTQKRYEKTAKEFYHD